TKNPDHESRILTTFYSAKGKESPFHPEMEYSVQYLETPNTIDKYYRLHPKDKSANILSQICTIGDPQPIHTLGNDLPDECPHKSELELPMEKVLFDKCSVSRAPLFQHNSTTISEGKLGQMSDSTKISDLTEIP